MTLIENREDQKKSIFKKPTQIQLAIVELMNGDSTITVKKISQKANISISSVRNYVQGFERAGELVTRRVGRSRESKILDMWLTEEAIRTIYDRFLTSLPENDKERLFTLLEEKIKEEKYEGKESKII